MMIRRFLGLAAVMALSACASGGWHRDNTSAAQFHQDRSDCEMRAATAYPVMMVSQGNGYQAPAQTNCTSAGYQTKCTTTPGMSVQPTQIDGNSDARLSATQSCIRGKGYVWRTK